MSGIEIAIAAAAAAAAGMTAYGDYNTKRAQGKLAQYQADVAESNRKSAQAQGVEQEHQARREQREFIGTQRAGLGEAGVFGKTSLDLLEESMINSEFDILNIRAQAEQNAANFLQQSQMKRVESKQYKKAARIALISGGLDMASSAALSISGSSTSSSAKDSPSKSSSAKGSSKSSSAKGSSTGSASKPSGGTGSLFSGIF